MNLQATKQKIEKNVQEINFLGNEFSKLILKRTAREVLFGNDMIQVRANGVFRDDDGLVACCHARMYAGQVFPVHSHKENEIFIIYSGCLDVFTETEPGKFQRNRLQPPHGLLFVNAGTNHYGECIHDMAGLFVTMPAAIEFP